VSPRVAVVVVTYRSGERIEACLRALREVSREIPIEVVVVDNASDDDTVERVAEGFPEVELVAGRENLGFAAGSNRGIAGSRADLVLLLNPDAQLPPGTLPALVEYLECHPEVGIVGPALESEPGRLQRDISATGLFPSFVQALYEYTRLGRWYPDSRWVRDYFLTDFDRRSIREVAMVQGACLLVRRALLERVGILDERFFLYFEETDLCKRAVDAGAHVHYVGDVAALHAGSGSSADGRPSARHFIASMYRFHAKHYGGAEAALLWTILAPYHLLRSARLGVRALVVRDDEQLRHDLRTAVDRTAAHFRLLAGASR